MRAIDYTGMRFGSLTAIKKVDSIIHPSGKKTTRWMCVCDCGNVCIIPSTSLRRKNFTRSCGCNWHNGKSNYRHGDAANNSVSRLYTIWTNMKQRCLNEKNPRYKDYGGRGISICDEWKDYGTFKKWSLQNGYKDYLTIDRVDNDGNYEPSNCRWTTMLIQRHNQRRLSDWIQLYREWEAGR